MELSQLHPHLGAQVIARPLLHGSVGFWDDVVGLVGAIILLSLLIYTLFFDKGPRDKRLSRPKGDDKDDRDE